MRFVIHKEEGLLFQPTEKHPALECIGIVRWGRGELREWLNLRKDKTTEIKKWQRISTLMERQRKEGNRGMEGWKRHLSWQRDSLQRVFVLPFGWTCWTVSAEQLQQAGGVGELTVHSLQVFWILLVTHTQISFLYQTHFDYWSQ